MSEQKKRHRWGREGQRGETCARCGVFRDMHFPVGGPRAQWIYEFPDGRFEVLDDSEPVPPCEPNKKTDKGDRK